MRIGALLRASTTQQSTKSQKTHIAGWAKRRCFGVEWYTEKDGTSGGLPLAERPETTRLLLDARAKRLDGIAVCEVSRLGRQEAVHNFIQVAELWLAKVPLFLLDFSEERPINLEDFGEFIRVALECGLAGEERKKDSVRTKRAVRRDDDGKSLGVSVYGKPWGPRPLLWTPELDAEILHMSATLTTLEIASRIVVGRVRSFDAAGKLCSVTGNAEASTSVVMEPPSQRAVERRLRVLRTNPG